MTVLSIETSIGDNLSVKFLARDSDKSIGFLSLDSLGKEYRTAYISELFVLPHYRKMGVGAELLKLAELEAHRRDKAAVTLQVSNNSAQAGLVEYYERRGFRVSYHYDTKEILMTKRLMGKS